MIRHADVVYGCLFVVFLYLDGWDVAVYSSIEHIYGYDYVTSDYKEKPEASWQKIVAHMNILFPSATEKQIKKILK